MAKTTKTSSTRAKPKKAPRSGVSAEKEPKKADVESKSMKSATDESVTEGAPGAEAKGVSTDALEGTTKRREVTQDKSSEPRADAESERSVSEAGSRVEENSVFDAHPVSNSPQQATTGRRGGFVPLVFGGVAAGLIGFGVAKYFEPNTDAALGMLEAQIAEQGASLSTRLEKIENQVASMDLEALREELAAERAARESLAGDLAARVERLASQVGSLEDRLVALEKRPVTEAVSPEAIAAYEREVAALQEAMRGQRAEIERLIAAQRAELDRIAAEAAQREQSAKQLARIAAARAALGRISAAIASGEPFAAALSDLEANSDLEIPEGLKSAAAEGVATAGALRDEFPRAARAALAAVREAEGPKGGTTTERLADFLRAQLGARSVVPREGDSPDAILSRAEAAVRDDRLDDALSEIERLPAVARAALAEWEARAKTRLAALQGAETVARALNAL